MNEEFIFGNEGIFDHSPAILTCKSSILAGRKVFRYFHMWKSHPEFINIVKNVWQEDVRGTKMYQLLAKMKKLKLELTKLNRSGFSHIEEIAKEAGQKIWMYVKRN